MGSEVLAVRGDRTGTVRVYAHSGTPATSVRASSTEVRASSTEVRADGQQRISIVVINLGAVNETVNFTLLGHGSDRLVSSTYANAYCLTSTGVESTQVALNGKLLVLGANGTLPTYAPMRVDGSFVVAPPLSITFVIFNGTSN
jgi:hypothetical protein